MLWQKKATTTTKGLRIQVKCDEENNFNNGEDSRGLLMMNVTRFNYSMFC